MEVVIGLLLILVFIVGGKALWNILNYLRHRSAALRAAALACQTAGMVQAAFGQI